MIIWIGIAILSIILLSLFLLSNYFYNLAVSRKDKEFLKKSIDLGEFQGQDPWEADRKWLVKQEMECLEIRSQEGMRLIAHFLPAKQETEKLAILAHGYASQGIDNGNLARFYHEELGFHVLMPDTRGHGQSGGDYIGFGWHDREDYLAWIAEMIKRLGRDCKILLHGVSMGGATVLMLSGEELPENVKCIISDSAYTSVKDVLCYQLKQMYKLPAFPFIHLTSLLTKRKAGYTFAEASALEQVKKTDKPILFIHGAEDTFVPTDMVYPLYKASRGEKEILLVPKAGHATSFFTDTDTYKEKLKRFVSKYL